MRVRRIFSLVNVHPYRAARKAPRLEPRRYLEQPITFRAREPTFPLDDDERSEFIKFVESKVGCSPVSIAERSTPRVDPVQNPTQGDR